MTGNLPKAPKQRKPRSGNPKGNIANLRMGGGRPVGVPNKVTQDFRATVTQLLERNTENVHTWLEQVANGHGSTEGDPAKALDLMAKLAEFAAPKLSRVDHTTGDKPMQLAPMIMPSLKP